MRIFIILSAFIFLVSCKQNMSIQNQVLNKEKAYQATLSEGKKLKFSLSKKESVETIRRAIANRKPLQKKIMPVFTMHITVKVGSEEQNWLFAKPNYIKSKSIDDSQVYTIDSSLVKLLN